MCCPVQVFRSSGQVPVLGNPYFRFYGSYTPYIYGVVPHGIAPGDDVRIYGDFQWSRLDMERYEPEDPRGYIREVRIGDFLCVSTHLSWMGIHFNINGDCKWLCMQSAPLPR